MQSICLGHLRFVTCSAFISGASPSDAGSQSSQAWLLTGGGDGTVRWGALAGEHCCGAGAQLHAAACQGRFGSVQMTPTWAAIVRAAPGGQCAAVAAYKAPSWSAAGPALPAMAPHLRLLWWT